MEIIENNFGPHARYYLHFNNEADFVVEKIISDLKETIQKLPFPVDFSRQFFLEFSDSKNLYDYDQFDLWHYRYYNSNLKLPEIFKYKKLKGIILDYKELLKIFRSGVLSQFIQNLSQVLYAGGHQSRYELGINLDWDDPIYQILFDYIDFDFISLSINSKIEVCYRNLDLERFDTELRHIAKAIGR